MTIPTAPRPSIRRALRPTLLLLPAFFVSILYLNSCSSAPTAEELMQQEMAQASAALGVAISSMDALESGVKTIEKRNIAGHSGLKPSDLWQVQYFRASLRGDAGELVPSKIVRMPLRKPLAGSDLYLCFDSQDALIHLGLSGDQAESEMETLWKGVLSQFEGYRAASTADLLTPSQAHRHWKEVTASTRSRGGSEELYAQKRFMALSRARLGQVFALTGRGEVPSAALLQDWRNQWSGLRTLSVDLGSVIGSSTAAEYDDIVTDAAACPNNRSTAANSITSAIVDVP